MKNLHLFTLLLLISVNSFTQSLNTKKSTISWTGKAAFNSYSLTGNLFAKSGTLVIKNDSITKLEVVIDMKSLDHKNKDLKKHLRNKDFFEVKKYKTASFTLLNPVKINEGKAVLIGNMTIKNTTKKEIIEVEINQEKGMEINFKTSLDRTKYGVKFNSPSFFKKMKENAIADEFSLTSNLFFD